MAYLFGYITKHLYAKNLKKNNYHLLVLLKDIWWWQEPDRFQKAHHILESTIISISCFQLQRTQPPDQTLYKVKMAF